MISIIAAKLSKLTCDMALSIKLTSLGVTVNTLRLFLMAELVKADGRVSGLTAASGKERRTVWSAQAPHPHPGASQDETV